MDNSKPKKKWQSSRLKDKKKELGIEDKPPEEAPVVESEGFKPVKKAFKKHDSYDKKSGSYDKKNGSYDKKFSKRNSYRDRDRKKYVIKISHLPKDITVQELNELVSPWGEIGNINIKIYTEIICCYIDFYNQEESDYFIKAIDSTPFDNLIIRAELMDFDKK